MKEDLILIEKIGLSSKAAKVYLAALELGESTVQTLAQKSSLKRTTIYYVLNELIDQGALIATKRNKKTYYLAEAPRSLLKRAREKLWDVENEITELEARQHAVYNKPRIYFLYGPSGFKQIWDKIFDSKTRDYRIITDGASFLDFVREKYILDDIIKRKRELNISSRQIIVDSPYAKEITAKDTRENRQSKFLPASCKLPFTEVITDTFVAFISPRWDDTLFVVENIEFAKTRKNLFETTWARL